MDLRINAANILFVLGHFTMNPLRLRLLSAVATSCLALSFASQPEPMLNVVAWTLFFVGLNLVQLARLLRSRWRGRGGVRRSPVARAPRAADLRAGAGTKAAFARVGDERDCPARPTFAAADAIAPFAYDLGSLLLKEANP